MSKKKKFSYTDYVHLLCREKLGEHYKFIETPLPTGLAALLGADPRRGFIYCEHYFGKNFNYAGEGPDLYKKTRLKRKLYPGAVARVELDSLVVLDQTMRVSQSIYNSDFDEIPFASPDFVERFMAIVEAHERVCQHYKLGQVRNPRKNVK